MVNSNYSLYPCDGCERVMSWIEPDTDLPRYCAPCNQLALSEYPLFWSNRIGETMAQKRKRLIADFQAIGGNAKQWHAELQRWESINLDAAGRYIGEPLWDYGFPFRALSHIPVDNRYAAMLSHRWAAKAVAVIVRKLSVAMEGSAAC